MSGQAYKDKRGHSYAVKSGIDSDTGVRTFIAFVKTPGGREHSLFLEGLLWRDTYAEAQNDLDRLAVRRRLVAV